MLSTNKNGQSKFWLSSCLSLPTTAYNLWNYDIVAEAIKRLKKVMKKDEIRLRRRNEPNKRNPGYRCKKNDFISASVGGSVELKMTKVPLCSFKTHAKNTNLSHPVKAQYKKIKINV